MPQKITPQQNQANTQNPNKGKNGVNQQNTKANGNRGKPLNPNQKKK